MPRLSFALLLFFSPALADHPLSLWQAAGEHNTVYLMGSIHLLRPQDLPLPSRMDAAYDEAETLVMELDMDDLDPVAMQGRIRELGMLEDGRTLQSVLGEDAWREAEQSAAAMNIPLHLFTQSEPWLAAITIEQLALGRLGFDARLGVELRYTERARRDGKPIIGLETMEEQLGFLDGLAPDAQVELLLQTLDEGVAMRELMDELIEAWRKGDTAFFESTLLADMRDSEELYAALIVERNRRWVDVIMDLLGDRRDYLVIVGTMHLVGEDGVPEQLEARGVNVRQLQQTKQQEHYQ